MRVLLFAAAVALVLQPELGLSQTNPTAPVGMERAYELDSGWKNNGLDGTVRVFEGKVKVDGAVWLRLYFGEANLDRDSVLRITSKLDGEVQELNARSLRMWNNSTAYFNGDEVTIELIAGPRTEANRIKVEKIELRIPEIPTVGCAYPCGICGTDDRVASAQTFSARLLPAGCTASVYNTDSCMVSAGHCMGGSMMVQFNVPPSTAGCTIVNPPIADQFPILASDSNNGGVGNDWAVMTVGTNNLGETPFDRYGEIRPIATTPPATGQALDIWGFGIDPDCTETQTQQTSGGTVTSVSTLSFNHSVDATCGNSGSSIIRAGEILGIATHCPCNNVATRWDHPSFLAARDTLCPTGNPACPGTGDCCSANGTPGCDDSVCCELVCACDPFCCDTDWDASCAGTGFVPGCGAELLCADCAPCIPADCDDADPCTDDVCVAGVCQNTNNTAPCEDGDACTVGDSCFQGNCVAGVPTNCDDGNACTVGDSCNSVSGACVPGTPVDCTPFDTECATASCNPAGGDGNCATQTPANEGLSCNGGLGICTSGVCELDPGATRVFMTEQNAAESPTVLLAPGSSITLDVLIEQADPQLVGSYQIALPGVATPIGGATGTVTYLDTPPPGGSARIDTLNPNWIFSAQQPAVFYAEGGLPTGFAMVSALSFGQGVLVTAPVYLGQFAMEASADACGSFDLGFLPIGAQPDGGSGVSNETGLGQVAAAYIPLQIDVGAENDDCGNAINLSGLNVSTPFSSTCSTQDGVAHACGSIQNDVWFTYSVACTGQLDISTQSGCSFDTAIAVYQNGATCTPSDGQLSACADNVGTCESVSLPVTFGEQLLVRVGSVAGQSGNGTLTIDCVPSSVTRVFMVAEGDEFAAPAAGETSVSMNAGETQRVEVWLDDTDGQLLGGYQMALPGVATLVAGASGSVTYVDGGLPGTGDSVFIDVADPDWALLGQIPVPTPAYSEFGLPQGFAMLVQLSFGQGVVVPGLAYLGEFDIATSVDACGEHLIDFLPINAPPNGGSVLTDQTGLGSVDATYQRLRVSVGSGNDACTQATEVTGPSVFAPISTVCATTDGVAHASCGQIQDDVWLAYTASCTGQVDLSTTSGCAFDTAIAVYRDGASCIPGEADLLGCADTLGACESVTIAAAIGDRLLVRVGSVSGDSGAQTLRITCTPDNAVTRVFMVAPEAEASATSDAPTRLAVLPGDVATIEVWVDDSDGRQLGGYQISIPGTASSTGGSGTVQYVDTAAPGGSVIVNEADPDWVFAGVPVSAQIAYGEGGLPAGFAMIASLPFGVGAVVPGLGYAGEFAFAASTDACGDFQLDFIPVPLPPNGGSGLTDETGLSEIPATYQPLNIVVGSLNDDCADATVLSGPSLSVDFNTVCAQTDGVAHACGNIESDLWFSYTAACTGELTVDLSENCTIDTSVAVYDASGGCVPGGGDLLQCADTPGDCESVSVNVTQGQPLLIRVGSVAGQTGPGTLNLLCGIPCQTAAECSDLVDNNMIIDDRCIFYECDGICIFTPRIHADGGSEFGLCPLDGFANIFDANHALSCFALTNPCDPVNHDYGGAFGDCAPDGFCNLFDANHALQAFAQVNACSNCPAEGGGPSPVASPQRDAGEATLHAIADKRAIASGETVDIRIFVVDAMQDFQSYQLEAVVSGGRRGSLELVDVTVESRSDGVFGRPADFDAANVQRGQMLAGVAAPVARSRPRGYLATYRFKASPNAVGTFVFDIAADGQTYLVSGFNGKVDVMSTSPAVVVVTSPRSTRIR